MNHSKFTTADDEAIIEFVRTRECLYNVRHARFRDRHVKNRLWKELGAKMNKDDFSIRRRWASMRDYFVRSHEKKHPTSYSERDESMMFLLDTSIGRKKTTSDVPEGKPITETVEYYYDSDALHTDNEASMMHSPSEDKTPAVFSSTNLPTADAARPLSPVAVNFPVSMMATSNPLSPLAVDIPTEKPQRQHQKRPTTVTMDELMQAVMNRPQPPLEQPAERDHMRSFCDGIYATLRTLPPYEVAQLKLDIATLVGKAEVAHHRAMRD